jgi:hypothetical protein
VLDKSVDWSHVYCQLVALQLTDPLFQAANFARLPVLLLWDVLEHCSKTERTKANAGSMATAKLGTVVVSALGSKGTKVKVSDFLPYEPEKGDGSVSEKTREAMKWALRNQRMPSQIIGLLGEELG